MPEVPQLAGGRGRIRTQAVRPHVTPGEGASSTRLSRCQGPGHWRRLAASLPPHSFPRANEARPRAGFEGGGLAGKERRGALQMELTPWRVGRVGRGGSWPLHQSTPSASPAASLLLCPLPPESTGSLDPGGGLLMDPLDTGDPRTNCC